MALKVFEVLRRAVAAGNAKALRLKKGGKTSKAAITRLRTAANKAGHYGSNLCIQRHSPHYIDPHHPSSGWVVSAFCFIVLLWVSQTSVATDDVDFVSSSNDFNFYSKHFDSFLTQITFVKKTVLLSVFLPPRLARVHHTSLSERAVAVGEAISNSTLSVAGLFQEVRAKNGVYKQQQRPLITRK